MEIIMRKRQSLNGLWDYRIGKGAYRKQQVPFSALPVGESECVIHFDRTNAESPRAFLIFEGITYAASVTLNGTLLGEMYAYAEYRFEVSDLLKDRDNVLVVALSDCDPAFGPSEGWENYGGIIRDIYLEYTEKTIIGDYLWHGALNEDYSRADCTVSIPLDGESEGAVVSAVLCNKHGRVVAEGTSDKGEVAFTVTDPELWSPDSPYLYRLTCSAAVNGTVTDTVSMAVGFKDFSIKGKRFYLNGKATFLLGINRHDLWGDQGHTMSEEQMRKDMMMIKSVGINYVRLVHYPHHRRIVEIADEIGLLISEEPGLWWSDMHNQEICNGALEVMRRTVLRDRNHISIAFWLSFNECIFTLEYLKDSVRVCRENDPYHMVSGANCMSIEMTKENYPICGFDFYTMHPYSSSLQRMKDSAEALTEMPLLFTEWGGYYASRNPFLFEQFAKYIVSTWKNPDEEKPVIAGAAYWFWAEMFEFSRGYPACGDGLLREALVDRFRNPLPDLEVYKNAFAALNLPEEPKEYRVTCLPVITEEGDYTAFDLSDCASAEDRLAAWDAMIEESRQPIPRYHHPKKMTHPMVEGPRLADYRSHIGTLPVSLESTPYVLRNGGSIVVPIHRKASMLYVIGNVSMPKGFPITGEYGELAGEYVVEYADGSTEVHPVRNGYEITIATGQHGPSRIEPYAANAPRVFRYHYRFDWEHYVINLGKIAVDPEREIKSLILREAGNGYSLLVYGVSAKL
jgi:hypothetical protein